MLFLVTTHTTEIVTRAIITPYVLSFTFELELSDDLLFNETESEIKLASKNIRARDKELTCTGVD